MKTKSYTPGKFLFAVACAFVMNTGAAFAQTWQALPFTYGPAGLLEAGTRRVYASAKGNTVITAYSKDVSPTESHISTDGGTTWNLALAGKPVETALFLPNGNILLATSRRYLTTNTFVADSLFRSGDGANWANLGVYSTDGGDKGDYAVSDDNKVFIPRSDGLNGPYFDVSADNGDTWTATGNLTNGINSVAVSATGDTIIVGNTNGVRYSHDGGATWNDATGGGWGHSENGGAAVLPNGDVYVAGPGKIYKSTDGGQTFSDLTPDPWIVMTGISHFHYHRPSAKFFIKNGPYGLLESADCITWTGVPALEAGGITDLAYSENYIYASSAASDTLYRYEIQGVTTGVAENRFQQSDVQIYPNPAHGFVTVHNIPVGSTVRLLDLAGKVVYSATSATESLNMRTDGLVNGIYIVQVESREAMVARRLVINN